jgi:hypothetical protein
MNTNIHHEMNSTLNWKQGLYTITIYFMTRKVPLSKNDTYQIVGESQTLGVP